MPRVLLFGKSPIGLAARGAGPEKGWQKSSALRRRMDTAKAWSPRGVSPPNAQENVATHTGELGS
jgi:hypothetical protein